MATFANQQIPRIVVNARKLIDDVADVSAQAVIAGATNINGHTHGCYVLVKTGTWQRLSDVRSSPPPAHVQWIFRRKSADFTSHALLRTSIAHVFEHVADPTRNPLHFGFTHSARSYGRAAQANSARSHRRSGIKRNRIFIDGNGRPIERSLCVLAGQPARMEIHQKK